MIYRRKQVPAPSRAQTARGFLHETVARLLTDVHAPVDELVHGCADDFISDLVVVSHQRL